MPALDSSTMGDSCSKMDRGAVVVQTESQPPAEERDGSGGQEKMPPPLPQQNAFAQPTMVTDLPPPPPRAATTGHKRKRQQPQHAPGSPIAQKQSLWRVGSRVLRKSTRGKTQGHYSPDSPTARASNYNHVHDMVQINFQEAASDRGNSSDDVIEAPLGVVGLRNLGNTCFLNSALQCLSATIPLTDYFLGYDYRKEINKDNFLGTGGKLVTAYAELLKAMWLRHVNTNTMGGRTRSHCTVQPVAFKQALEKFAPQFRGTYQQDAQELLSFLLDGIHEDLNRIKNKPYIEDRDCDGSQDEKDAMDSWKNYLLRDKSLVVDIFQGQLKSTLTCLTCGHTNIRFEPFMYLSLPVSETCRTLDDCLQLYLAQDTLTGANQWYCSKCKKHVDATKKTDLWILPPILICHLKRFKVNAFGQRGSKLSSPIEYPVAEWDLEPSVSRRGGQRLVYDLYAVSNHVGGLGGGHYTAYSLNRFNDVWYEFNDSSYRPVSPNDLARNSSRSSAYLLFYNRSRSDRQGGTPDGRAPMIRRQSVSRPDLWPHLQVENHQFREFERVSSVGNTPTTPSGRPVIGGPPRSTSRFSALALSSLAPPWLGGKDKATTTEETKTGQSNTVLNGVPEEKNESNNSMKNGADTYYEDLVFMDANQHHEETEDVKKN